MSCYAILLMKFAGWIVDARGIVAGFVRDKTISFGNDGVLGSKVTKIVSESFGLVP